MSNAYVAFFEGDGPLVVSARGGAITSPGIIAMAAQARTDNVSHDIFEADEYQTGLSRLQRMRALGLRTAAVGYSASVGTIGLISYFTHLDFLAGIDPSRDCVNYKIFKPNVVKSILWHNNSKDLLALMGIGGAGDKLGFDERIEINVDHLAADLLQSIKDRVRVEILKLKG